MKNLVFILSTTLLVSCSVQKELTSVKRKPITNTSNSRYMTKSRSLQSQREEADLMDSWTQEQVDEYKRKYVYSEINIILKNGDTLKFK